MYSLWSNPIITGNASAYEAGLLHYLPSPRRLHCGAGRRRWGHVPRPVMSNAGSGTATVQHGKCQRG